MGLKSRLLTGQAVILAAGKSTRFWPLNKRHKSLFEIMGRPLISYTLENLEKAGIKEIIIVQNSQKDIEKELKTISLPFSKGKVKYVIQRKPCGTGDAIISAEKHLKEKFLVINGDDFYDWRDLKKCLTKFPSILVKETKNPCFFGVIVEEKGRVKGIIEKPKKPITGLVNAGCYFLPKTIFKEKLEKSQRGEYEITDYIKTLARKQKVFYSQAENWLPLTFSWDLLEINEFLLKGLKRKIAAKIEKNCQIQGPVFLGKGTIVKSGAYIQGPVYIGQNCQIGPNCYIKGPVTIGNNCLVGQATEIGRSIIGQNSRIAHLSFIGDSIVGQDCNLGCGTICANLRFDEENVRVQIKGKLVDTGRKKLGAVLGNRVKVGINTSLMPGVLVGADSIIGPHSLVKENIDDKTKHYTQPKKSLRGVNIGG